MAVHLSQNRFQHVLVITDNISMKITLPGTITQKYLRLIAANIEQPVGVSL